MIYLTGPRWPHISLESILHSPLQGPPFSHLSLQNTVVVVVVVVAKHSAEQLPIKY
jgi:hypothetical protein